MNEPATKDASSKDTGSNALEKSAGLIPHLYYDIIARIVPGGIFLAACASNLDFDSLPITITGIATESWIPTTAVFVGASYVAGILITVIAIIIDVVWHFLARSAACVLSERDITISSPWKIATDIDEISTKNPDAARALFKLYAEVTLFENLIGAVVVYCCIFRTCIPISPLSVVVGVMLFLGLLFRIATTSQRTAEWMKRLSRDSN